MVKGTRGTRSRWEIPLALLLCLGVGLATLRSLLPAEEHVREIVAQGVAPLPPALVVTPTGAPAFKVLTLNLAHGRRDAYHQLLIRTATIEQNLDRIAALLRVEAPDVVALQEADGPSFWSGRFDHVAHLGEVAGLPFGLGGEHVRFLGLRYGAALLSKSPLAGGRSQTFALSLPTFPKGFVEAEALMPGPDGAPVSVRVVSVHLDFASGRVRARQVDRLADALQRGSGPLIVMGDFNGDYREGGPPRRLADALSLKVFEPDGPGMGTFPAFDSRLDWILISRELAFTRYVVLPEVVSDHLAVVAEVTWADDAGADADGGALDPRMP